MAKTSSAVILNSCSRFKVGVQDTRMLIVNDTLVHKIILDIKQPNNIIPTFDCLLENELEDFLGYYLSKKSEIKCSKIHTSSFHIDIESYPWWSSEELKNTTVNGKSLQFDNTEYLFEVNLCPLVGQDNGKANINVADKNKCNANYVSVNEESSKILVKEANGAKRRKLSSFSINNSSEKLLNFDLQHQSEISSCSTASNVNLDSITDNGAIERKQQENWSFRDLTMVDNELELNVSGNSVLTTPGSVVDVETVETLKLLRNGLDSSDNSPQLCANVNVNPNEENKVENSDLSKHEQQNNQSVSQLAEYKTGESLVKAFWEQVCRNFKRNN